MKRYSNPVYQGRRLRRMVDLAEKSAKTSVREAVVLPQTQRVDRRLSAETIAELVAVLGINAIDLFATVGWLTADELPSLGTYLSAKFSHPPDAVVRHIEHHVTKILHAYSHSAGDRHNTDDPEVCPWCSKHFAQQPGSPKEHPHEP